MTGRWAGVPVTASGGTAAPLAASVEADCDDRAVRLALAAGAANLRLLLVRDALKDCCPEDRARILGALGRAS